MSPLPGPTDPRRRFDRDAPLSERDLVADLPDLAIPGLEHLLPPLNLPGLAPPVVHDTTGPDLAPPVDLQLVPETSSRFAWRITYRDGSVAWVTSGAAYARVPGGAEGWREALEFRDGAGAVVGRVSGDDVESVRLVALR